MGAIEETGCGRLRQGDDISDGRSRSSPERIEEKMVELEGAVSLRVIRETSDEYVRAGAGALVHVPRSVGIRRAGGDVQGRRALVDNQRLQSHPLSTVRAGFDQVAERGIDSQ